MCQNVTRLHCNGQDLCSYALHVCEQCFVSPLLFDPRSTCDTSALASLCQEVIEGLEECLSFDLQALKDRAPSGVVEGEEPRPKLYPPVALQLPCDLVIKLASIAILSAHSLRIRGMFAL